VVFRFLLVPLAGNAGGANCDRNRGFVQFSRGVEKLVEKFL
jgi:hypothetical protein